MCLCRLVLTLSHDQRRSVLAPDVRVTVRRGAKGGKSSKRQDPRHGSVLLPSLLALYTVLMSPN